MQNFMTAKTSREKVNINRKIKIGGHQEFPGSPGIKILWFHCQGPSLIPGLGTKGASQVAQC